MDLLDAISSGRKNKKAKDLVASAEKMIDDVDSEIAETDSKFESDINNYTALRDDVTADVIKTFDDTYIQIQNVDFKGSIVTYTDDTMENIGDEFCNCKHEIEPLEIKKVKSGLFGAGTGAIVVGAAALAAALSVAVMQMGIEVDTKTIPAPEQINSVLEWFGRGDMTIGASALGGGVAIITLITGYLLLNSRSKKNLLRAEVDFTEATAAHLDKSTQNRKTMSMTEYIETMEKNLKTLQVYLNEFNAVLQRIVHIEGTDYAAYSITSQRDVHTALSIYKRVKGLICTKVVAPEGAVTSKSKYEMEKGTEFIKELAKKWR